MEEMENGINFRILVHTRACNEVQEVLILFYYSKLKPSSEFVSL